MSPTGGRQPVPRGVFAIEDQQLLLPDPIALDTSFVVEALLTTQPLHPACSAFLKRIFDSGVAVVTSDLLAVELAESAFAITLKERWGGRWRGHRTDGRSRRPASRRLNHTVMSYEALALARQSPADPRPSRDRRRQGLDDRLRHRFLRRRARGQRHRRWRRGDRRSHSYSGRPGSGCRLTLRRRGHSAWARRLGCRGRETRRPAQRGRGSGSAATDADSNTKPREAVYQLAHQRLHGQPPRR